MATNLFERSCAAIMLTSAAHDDNLGWILSALTESPRLHVTRGKDGSFAVETSDDQLLYTMVDSRHLPNDHALHSTDSEIWRCFFTSVDKSIVAEARRHVSRESSIGLSILHNGNMLKTGLENISSSGLSRYSMKWLDSIYYFESTVFAPNTTRNDKGSLRCVDSKGSVLAWLAREQGHAGEYDRSGQPCAIIWFEELGIQNELAETIISSFASITDVWYPFEPSIA